MKTRILIKRADDGGRELYEPQYQWGWWIFKSWSPICGFTGGEYEHNNSFNTVRRAEMEIDAFLAKEARKVFDKAATQTRIIEYPEGQTPPGHPY